MYIIPSQGDFDHITDVTKKAGASLVNPQKVRDLILADIEGGIVLCAASTSVLHVLARHPDALLEEMPTVVMSVPGLIYDGDWVATASAFPPMDWTELERKLAKSGHLANTPADMAKRDIGVSDGRLSYDEALADASHDEGALDVGDA